MMKADVFGNSLQDRQQFITEMQTFIKKECSEIGEVMAQMSWSPAHILKSSSTVTCPHDPNHHVPKASLEGHTSVCRLRKMGLSSQDVDLQLQNDDFFYENANLVGKVQLDEGLLNRIIWNHCMEHRQVHMGHRSMPVGVEDWTVKLTSQERLAVYEYCVQTLKGEGKMANVEKDEVLTTDWEKIIKKGLLDQGDDKPQSKAELLAMLRDQKRRRQSYRAKNVHVTKKSYTGIIREVIMNQMEIMMPAPETERRDRLDSPPHSRDYSRSPRRERNRSASPDRRRSKYVREDRSRSPRRRRSRSRSRSRSPRGRKGGNSKQRRDESSSSWKAEDPDVDERSSSQKQVSRQEKEEGQLMSDDSYSEGEKRRHRSKKKSAKHKKHKHKKHKSKSAHSDSDDYY